MSTPADTMGLGNSWNGMTKSSHNDVQVVLFVTNWMLYVCEASDPMERYLLLWNTQTFHMAVKLFSFDEEILWTAAAYSSAAWQRGSTDIT